MKILSTQIKLNYKIIQSIKIQKNYQNLTTKNKLKLFFLKFLNT